MSAGTEEVLLEYLAGQLFEVVIRDEREEPFTFTAIGDSRDIL
jgi:hypothetical protein